MLILFVLSMIFLSMAIFGFYTWGKMEGNFGKADSESKGYIFGFLVMGIILMLFAGRDWGTGEFAPEKGAFEEGVVYVVHAQAKVGDIIYAQVSQNGDANMRAVTFSNPPPGKFAVLKDNNGNIFYITVQ